MSLQPTPKKASPKKSPTSRYMKHDPSQPKIHTKYNIDVDRTLSPLLKRTSLDEEMDIDAREKRASSSGRQQKMGDFYPLDVEKTLNGQLERMKFSQEQKDIARSVQRVLADTGAKKSKPITDFYKPVK